MQIVQTPTFGRALKKLHKNQFVDIDKAIGIIAKDPLIGAIKKGDLAGVYVYKFSMVHQQTLIAYRYDPAIPRIVLLALGSHENFYRDIK